MPPFRFAALLWAAAFFFFPSPAGAETPPEAKPLVVGAAASLRNALEEVAEAFGRQAGQPVALNLAGSNALAGQVLAGAPMDLAIFAGQPPMDRLEAAGLLRGRFDLLANRLAAVVRADASPGEREAVARLFSGEGAPSDVPEGFRLALANPETAPAGRYAKQSLERLGLWETLKPRIVFAEHVRQAAAWVESGDADAGLLYRTDALSREGLAVAAIFPEGLHDPIIYSAAQLAASGHPSAEAFLDFCAESPEAASAFARAGFRLIERGRIQAETSSPAPPPVRGARPFAVMGPLRLTLKIAFCALLLNALLGTPLAWLLARKRFRGKALLEALLLLPLALPPTVAGFALIALLGSRGPLGGLLEAWLGWTPLFSWQGAALAAGVVSFPLFLKPAQSAFEGIPRAYFEEGELMGMGELQAFWHLGLPMGLRGLLCGAALSFARAMGEFGATLMVAGNIPGQTRTLPLAIYSAAAIGDNREAAFYSLILGVMALALVLLARPLAAKLDFEAA